MSELTKAERDSLLARAWAAKGRLYPKEGGAAARGREAATLRETYYRILGEYSDRLPRIVMSACPFSGALLKHSFDPWGVDGPWWHQDREVEIDEPPFPSTFKVLLGALAFHGRAPAESRSGVIPGPEVPFVVPRLLALPGMVAVVSRLDLTTGDTAYPIAYFSQETIAPEQLHQFWLEQDFWFKLEAGGSAWLIANDRWDFELEPWIRRGKVKWITPGSVPFRVEDGRSGTPCPYVDLEGDRFPQVIAFGERNLVELPDGTPVNPYEE